MGEEKYYQQLLALCVFAVTEIFLYLLILTMGWLVFQSRLL